MALAKRWIWMVGLTASMFATTGCASAPAVEGRYVSDRSGGLSESLLFSPGSPESVAAVHERSNWPSTSNPNPNPERIRFRETIYDRQGWFRRQDQFPIRRFRSVRTGTTSR